MKKLIYLPLIIFCCMLSNQLTAQDFTYKPKNPAFGGDSFNYSWMLNSAQSQDLTIDTRESEDLGNAASSLDDFTESLNRQLLSQLSRQLVTGQFGEGGLDEGNYVIGNFQVDVASTLDGVAITILDTSIGEQTQIIIPFF